MSLLKSVQPELAVGGMKRIHDSFLDAVGMVPPPLVVSSASPALQALLTTLMVYYREHPTPSQKLIALIRYVTSVIFEMTPCVRFNENALRIHGMTDNQIREAGLKPGAVPLKAAEKELFDFVI